MSVVAPLPVAGKWFRMNRGEHGVARLQEHRIDQMLESNVWHVRGAEADLVIDTGNGIGRLRPQLDRFHPGQPMIAVATHGHFDHTGGMPEFDDRRCHEADVGDVREPYPLTLVRERYPDDLDAMFAYYGYEAPGVCPGTCRTSTVRSPRSMASPSATNDVGSHPRIVHPATSKPSQGTAVTNTSGASYP